MLRHHVKLSKLQAYRKDWPWDSFKGSPACLKWSFRDLQQLDKTLLVVPGRKLVVQAGGNLGLFPKRLAEEFEQVITFEPDAKLFAKLKFNAPEGNIQAIRAALGCQRTPVRLSSRRRDSSGRASHEGLTHVSGYGVIPQVMLDDMGLPACDLIYLDIEGYEFFALLGAEKTIDRFRPVIGIEVNRNIGFYGQKAETLRSWIVSKNYKLSFTLNSDEVYIPC